MRRLIHSISIILAVCAWDGFAQASDVSFLQLPLAGGDGLRSDYPSEQTADNFSFAAKTKVKSVRWWGTYFTSEPDPDQFRMRFFNDQAGIPPRDFSNEFTNLTVSRSDSGLVDSFGDTIYQYQAQIPTPVVFTAGSTAYLSVLNSTVNGWFWQKNSNAGSNWFRFDDEDSWFSSTSGNVAFELVGVTPPPGDYNADFTVNQNDYSVWKPNFGSTAQLAADGNGNGIVDAADYVVWRNNFGTLVGSGVTVGSVPEPATAVLAIGFVLGGLLMRRHRQIALSRGNRGIIRR